MPTKTVSGKLALAVTSLPSPSTALAGLTVRLTTDNKPYWCDGTQWVGMSAGKNITISSKAPSNPAVYDLWIKI